MNPTRQCPYCDDPTEGEFCDVHAVPTVDASILEHPPKSIEPGSIIARRYRIERVLSVGGFGAVYVGTQLGMNRTIALKVLRRERLTGTQPLKRFYREALSISRLNHPNIVQVFDFGIDEKSKVPFIVFEFVKGQTLTELLIKGGPLPEAKAAKILGQVAKALVEAHAQGIIHRDLKPNNLIVSTLRDGEPHLKVLDFGLAKLVKDKDGLTGLTKPGSMIGTAHFSSPEQLLGAQIDIRADLYSLGCLLFAMLTGTPPFDGKLAELLHMHTRQPPPMLPGRLADGRPPSQGIQTLCSALLKKAPVDRPANASLVAKILGALGRSEPIDVMLMLSANGFGHAAVADVEDRFGAQQTSLDPNPVEYGDETARAQLIPQAKTEPVAMSDMLRDVTGFGQAPVPNVIVPTELSDEGASGQATVATQVTGALAGRERGRSELTLLPAAGSNYPGMPSVTEPADPALGDGDPTAPTPQVTDAQKSGSKSRRSRASLMRQETLRPEAANKSAPMGEPIDAIDGNSTEPPTAGLPNTAVLQPPSVEPARPSSNTKSILGGVAVVLAVLAVFVVLQKGAKEETVGSLDTPPITTPVVSATKAPAEQPVARPGAYAKPSPGERTDVRMVMVRTQPAGASVLHMGKKAGDTPVRVPVPKGEAALVWVNKPGYKRKQVLIPAESLEVSVQLSRVSKPKGTNPSRATPSKEKLPVW